MNLELLLRLLAAHFAADFIFQPNYWVKEKAEKKISSKYLYYHTLIIFALTLLAAWNFSFLRAVLLITISHYLLDTGKSYLRKDTPAIFIIDQALHILIIIICWMIFESQFTHLVNEINFLFNNTTFWMYVTAYLLMTMPASVFISKFTSRWMKDIDTADDSLKDAGRWIGIIERILILTFIILNQLEAIGLLIAAKSVFRFGELKNSGEQKKAEYILIGTLASFSVAVIAGIILSAVSR
jgi:hypothetical protein